MQFEDIERMRAELLNRYGPTERPEVFDDGASLLGQNPYMQEVGMFKAPKFNPARRTMGLDLSKARTPTPAPIETPSNAIVPAQPAPAQPINPLETLANMPITRRKVLEIPMNAAISNVGRGLIGQAVAPAVESAITNIAPKAVESTFVRNPVFDEYFQEYAAAIMSNASENMPNEAGIAAYQLLREYLKEKIPEKTLKKYDKISDEADYVDEEGNFLESSYDAQNELENFIFDNLKHLKPNELQDFSDQMIQYETTPKEFADDVIRNFSNYQTEDVKINSNDLIKYLEDSWSQK